MSNRCNFTANSVALQLTVKAQALVTQSIFNGHTAAAGAVISAQGFSSVQFISNQATNNLATANSGGFGGVFYLSQSNLLVETSVFTNNRAVFSPGYNLGAAGAFALELRALHLTIIHRFVPRA